MGAGGAGAGADDTGGTDGDGVRRERDGGADRDAGRDVGRNVGHGWGDGWGHPGAALVGLAALADRIGRFDGDGRAVGAERRARGLPRYLARGHGHPEGVPAGTTTLVIGRAAIGQEATTSRNELTGLLSLTCEGAWTLTSAEPEKLVFTSRLVRSSLPGACTGGSYSETLTLQKDGTVRFGSADPSAGNPSGTLRRAG